MLRTRMTTLAFVLSELFPLDVFRCNFVSAYPLEYNHDTSQLYRTGHDRKKKKKKKKKQDLDSLSKFTY